ncbi:MAG: YeeE/YedE thiosulfate transporter family protein [Saprospiraceae bacterium]
MKILLLATSLIDFISQPWHWAVSGAAIAFVLFMMTWLGQRFGVSSIFIHLCTIAGAGRKYEFFKEDIKNFSWRIAFVVGSMLGGYLALHYLSSPAAVAISPATIAHLQNDFHLSYPQGEGFLPVEVVNLLSVKGWIMAIVGGFLVGFGSRYGNGCTSGHAITGLSHLQLPSLITVIGFFIGGLIMTWGLLPFILG